MRWRCHLAHISTRVQKHHHERVCSFCPYLRCFSLLLILSSFSLYFSTVARLYRHTGNPVDYENAVRTLNWWLTWGFDADTGKVYDTMGYPGCMSNRTGLDAWSYNSGAFLFGLADLYYATGNETLLDIGRSIAYAAMRDFSILETGIIQEHCEHDPAPPNSGLPTGCQQDEVAVRHASPLLCFSFLSHPLQFLIS